MCYKATECVFKCGEFGTLRICGRILRLVVLYVTLLYGFVVVVLCFFYYKCVKMHYVGVLLENIFDYVFFEMRRVILCESYWIMIL